MCGASEKGYRAGIKSKYDGGISDAAVRQYESRDGGDITKWNRTLPPNDTWMATKSTYGGETQTKIVVLLRLNSATLHSCPMNYELHVVSNKLKISRMHEWYGFGHLLCVRLSNATLRMQSFDVARLEKPIYEKKSLHAKRQSSN